MAHTFTSILLHVIFSTKNRAPSLTPELRERLFPYMGGLIRERKATALLINGMEDHVHILTSLPITMALSDFVRDIKSISSGWVHDGMATQGEFGWQTGYAAFSVSKSSMETVRTYIAKPQPLTASKACHPVPRRRPRPNPETSSCPFVASPLRDKAQNVRVPRCPCAFRTFPLLNFHAFYR